MLVSIPARVGYAALAALVFGESAGLPIPGETALLTAGGQSARGALDLPAVILVAAGAAIVGDTVGYLVGRRYGRRALLRGGRFAAHRRHAVERSDRFFARNGTATIFLGRFVPGVRVVAAVMAGTTRMPWPRFAVANAGGALCWAAAIGAIANLAGPAGAAALATFGLAGGGILLALAWWRARRRASTLGSQCVAPSPSGPA